ncbi:MAG: hybrid sensor histidine kinase/response regulator, partial [Alkaliphilus sp.]
MAERRPMLLIVDDEPNNLHAMKRILEPMEVDIVEAASGQEALRAVLHHDFFMILMDLSKIPLSSMTTSAAIVHF